MGGVDIEDGRQQEWGLSHNTTITWDFGGSGNDGTIEVKWIDADDNTINWGGLTEWRNGSNGTLENNLERTSIYGTNATAIVGAEHDGDEN